MGRRKQKQGHWNGIVYCEVTFLEGTAGAYEAEDLASVDQVIPD